MSDDVLVRVEGVSKKFCRSLKRSLWYGISDITSELLPVGKADDPSGSGHHALRREEFWAVDDVSFELRRGECLGLIGRNGAGKTTLLKVLNGLVKPDKGRIEMRGQVSALIALGAGFNPILTGRENIYVNGSVLGLKKKEIGEKIEEIIDFADVRDFIDAPVQSYSSGMQVRLGFAVATALEPDVLLLDEVLAVGDASFRHKCYHRINKLLKNAAVILVSHSMEYVSQMCSSAMMMRRGKGEWFADPVAGVSAYAKDNESSHFAEDGGKVEMVYPPIRSVQVRTPVRPVRHGSALTIEVEIESDAEIDDLILSFTAVNLAEQPVMNWHMGREGRTICVQRGRQIVRFSVDPLLLHAGRYAWNLSATRRGSIEHCIWLMRAGEFVVEADFRPCGNIPYLPAVTHCEVFSLP